MYNVINKIENGSKTLFSHESWLDGEVVKDHFCIQFNNLMTNKNVYVEDM